MKRIRSKKISTTKTPRKKVVVNEKLIPKGHFCYSIIPDSESVTFNEELQCEVPTFKVKNCPYLNWKSYEHEHEHGSYCSLLGVELDDEIKECGINLPDELDNYDYDE
jgi:hypothetical protein